MATVTGYTAERMKAIEDASVVGGYVDASSHLILQQFDGGLIDAGYVKGDPATALLTKLDTASVTIELTGAGTPEEPWVISATATAASEAVPGVSAFATPAEITLGAEANKTVTPASLKTAVETGGLYRIRLNSNTDASLTSTNHGLQIGDTDGVNMIMDVNEILVRDNGGPGTIYVNPEGAVNAGNPNYNTTIYGSLRLPQGNKILWGPSSGMYMRDGQSVTLSESVTSQATGIVLCWSYFSGSTPGNSFWTYTFVPKWHVSDHSGAGVQCILSSNNQPPDMISKYVYVNNTLIEGYSTNDDGLGSSRVLRAVIGV